MIFDRPDKIINLCEIKCCQDLFVIDKKYAALMRNREKIYVQATGTKKQVFHSMIVSGGLKKNLYSEELIASCATLDDLFKE